MRKIRIYFDKDKEEVWLNRMCAKGWAMTGFFLGVYTFQPCEPEKYTYRIDMPGEIGKNSIRDQQKREYIEFVEETDAEYVCDWGWWVFFRKETAKGKFELYTDSESKIALYKRIRKMFFLIGLLEVYVGVMNTERLISNSRIYGAEMAFMVLIYLIIAVFVYIIIKTTVKINKLQKETYLDKNR